MPLLNGWNLFLDLPHDDLPHNDLPHDDNLFTAADMRTRGIYDKLFRGCNLPAMTPGEPYVPRWTTAEIGELEHVLALGLAELRARLR